MQAGQRVGRGEQLHVLLVELGVLYQILRAIDRAIRARPGDALGRDRLELVHHAQAQAQGRRVRQIFQRTVHLAGQHVHWPHFHLVALGVLDRLRRSASWHPGYRRPGGQNFCRESNGCV